MKLFIILFVLSALGIGVYVFAHGYGPGGRMMGDYYGGHHMRFRARGSNFCGGYDNEDNNKINVKYEKNKNGIIIKLTSKDKDEIKRLHKRADYEGDYYK